MMCSLENHLSIQKVPLFMLYKYRENGLTAECNEEDYRNCKMSSHVAYLLVTVWVTYVYAATKVPKCLDTDIAKIKSHWASTGGAPSVLEAKDTFHIIAGTNSAVAGEAKCKHFSISAPSANVKTPTLNIQEVNVHLPFTMSNGVMTITEESGHVISSYIISFGAGIIAGYKCSADGPAVSNSAPADVTLSAAPAAKPADITAVTNTLKTLGFNIASFGCQ